MAAKSEPESYGWADLVRDGRPKWDGVRNNAAAAHLRAMQIGDRALFYHCGAEKAAVGVIRSHTGGAEDGDEGNWVSVAVRPVEAHGEAVTLSAAMKASRAGRIGNASAIPTVGVAGSAMRNG